MRRIGALLGLWPLVWTKDADYCGGDVRLRIAWRSPFGGWSVNSIVPYRKGALAPNGIIENGSYMKRWAEWKYNRKHVTFPEAQ